MTQFHVYISSKVFRQIVVQCLKNTTLYIERAMQIHELNKKSNKIRMYEHLFSEHVLYRGLLIATSILRYLLLWSFKAKERSVKGSGIYSLITEAA